MIFAIFEVSAIGLYEAGSFYLSFFDSFRSGMMSSLFSSSGQIPLPYESLTICSRRLMPSGERFLRCATITPSGPGAEPELS